jgi:hypothetical protein
MWEILVEPDKPQIIIWRMRNARWINKVKNTNSEYAKIIDFPLQI